MTPEYLQSLRFARANGRDARLESVHDAGSWRRGTLRATIFVLSLGLSICAGAQERLSSSGQLVIGRVDSLYSNVLGEQRDIWIYLPDGIREGERYPVIYLLDPSAHFHVATGILGLLSKWRMPPSIVVGIDTGGDRIGDLTPTHVPFHRGHNSETSGGAPEFARFIQTELQPYIFSRYPADDINTIIGHSTGGLFVIYAYLHHSELFDNYLAIEPSLWWDGEVLVSESETILAVEDRQDRHLNVAVANSTDFDTLSVRLDTEIDTEQLRANLRFRDVLRANDDRADFHWEYFGTEDHSSVVVPGLYNGLRTLFSWYTFTERWRFNTPDQYTAEELTGPFYTHFSELSRRMKREIRPDWQFVNDVGMFMLTGHDAPDKAVSYLQLNLHYYPDSSKTHVALGKFYATHGRLDEASRYYERAVELDGNSEARDSLQVLRKGN